MNGHGKPLDSIERAKLTRKKRELEEQRKRLRRLRAVMSNCEGDALAEVRAQVDELEETILRLDSSIGEAIGSTPAHVIEKRREARREARRAAKLSRASIPPPAIVEAQIDREKARRRRRKR